MSDDANIRAAIARKNKLFGRLSVLQTIAARYRHGGYEVPPVFANELEAVMKDYAAQQGEIRIMLERQHATSCTG